MSVFRSHASEPKGFSQTSHYAVDDAFEHTDLPPEKAGTAPDRRDMYRMGKAQEFKRNFTFIPIFGFAAVLMITWEGMLNALSYPLPNGGLPTMVYMFLVAWFGFGAAILTMAEMASMAPTSGGQYHWVSEFAPPSCQKILSYVVGWFCVLGWQSGIAGQCFTVALQIQGLVILNKGDYVPKDWHIILLTVATATAAVIFNSFFARKLPFLEGLVLVLHVFGFFAILIPLWVFAPRNPSAEVWSNFTVTSGWNSRGVAVLIGMMGPLYAIMGPDSAVHMSEEVKDASRILPWAMCWTLALNGITGFIMTVTFAYCIGPLANAVEPEYNFAFIGTFYFATKSKAGATVMTCIILSLTFASAISNVATASRQMFAFARDDGLPFSKFWAYVRPGWDIPFNCVLFSAAFATAMCLIVLGSSTAFNAVLSIGVVALLTSYLVSLGCVMLMRIRGQPLLPRRWSLGRVGGFICNAIGLAFVAVSFVFSFFPIGVPVTAGNMNWASGVYGGVGLLATFYYIVYARHRYVPPVSRLAKDL